MRKEELEEDKVLIKKDDINHAMEKCLARIDRVYTSFSIELSSKNNIAPNTH